MDSRDDYQGPERRKSYGGRRRDDLLMARVLRLQVAVMIAVLTDLAVRLALKV